MIYIVGFYYTVAVIIISERTDSVYVEQTPRFFVVIVAIRYVIQIFPVKSSVIVIYIIASSPVYGCARNPVKVVVSIGFTLRITFAGICRSIRKTIAQNSAFIVVSNVLLVAPMRLSEVVFMRQLFYEGNRLISLIGIFESFSLHTIYFLDFSDCF